MKLVIALGGNALLRRGQVLSAQNQLLNIEDVALQIARVAIHHQVLLTHGNGPQVGLLALQSAAYTAVESYPLDVLGAQTQGMIGYMLEQSLANALPASHMVTTLLSRVQIDSNDPAFTHPSKPIGPVYTQAQAEKISASNHWVMAPDGKDFRRVVPSPKPIRVMGIDAISCLLARGALVIAAGGGGIPVARDAHGPGFHGVEAVIDKDLCSSLLACELGANCLVIATDVEAVYLDWGLPTQRAIDHITPSALGQLAFADGTMGPKVEAAISFVLTTGNRAVIGSLKNIEKMLAGHSGTQVLPGAHRV
jgi:carbamate kinase